MTLIEILKDERSERLKFQVIGTNHAFYLAEGFIKAVGAGQVLLSKDLVLADWEFLEEKRKLTAFQIKKAFDHAQSLLRDNRDGRAAMLKELGFKDERG